MAIQLQLRRGNTLQHATFTGAIGEITYDTSNNTVRVHNGNTAGGVELASKSDLANVVVGNVSVSPNLASNTTDDLPEGSANLYFTNARSIAALTGGENVTIEANGMIISTASGGVGAVESVNGEIGNVVLSTANVAEDGNLYFTNARAVGALTAGGGIVIEANGLVIVPTSSISNGTTSVNIPLANGAIVFNADGVEDVADINAWGLNVNSNLNVTGDIFGNLYSLANHTTSSLAEGSNLYFTNTRAIAAFTAGDNITIESNGMVIASMTANVEANVAWDALTNNIIPAADGTLNVGNTTNRFAAVYADAVAIGNIFLKETNGALIYTNNIESNTNIFDTDDITEGNNNLYYTDTRVNDYLATVGVGTLIDDGTYANANDVAALSTGNISFANTTMSSPDGEDLIITAANAEVQITGLDFRVETTDDIRLQASDLFSIRNISNTEPITIVTDYNGTAYTWRFGEDGSFQIPGDTTVAGQITGTGGASTLVLAAEPNSNTYIQLNDTVDSTISTVANLEIRTDVTNTAQVWVFGVDGNLVFPDGTVQSTAGGAGFDQDVNTTDSPNFVNLGLSGSNSTATLATTAANLVVAANGYDFRFTEDGDFWIGTTTTLFENTVRTEPNNSLTIAGGADLQLYAETAGITLWANGEGDYKVWELAANANMIFPDGTVQSTAFNNTSVIASFTGGNNITIEANGLIVGTASGTVYGDSNVATYLGAVGADVIPSGNTYNLGESSNVWNNVYANNVIVSGQLSSPATGIPTIQSDTSIRLTANDAVVVTSSPLHLASFSFGELMNITAANGMLVFNTTNVKVQAYVNGNWVDLH